MDEIRVDVEDEGGKVVDLRGANERIRVTVDQLRAFGRVTGIVSKEEIKDQTSILRKTIMEDCKKSAREEASFSVILIAPSTKEYKILIRDLRVKLKQMYSEWLDGAEMFPNLWKSVPRIVESKDRIRTYVYVVNAWDRFEDEEFRTLTGSTIEELREFAQITLRFMGTSPLGKNLDSWALTCGMNLSRV